MLGSICVQPLCERRSCIFSLMQVEDVHIAMPDYAKQFPHEAFYHCRYCCSWKASRDFSSQQLVWAETADGHGRGRGALRRPEPVCRSCANFAISLESSTSMDSDEENERSVGREVRYATCPLHCALQRDVENDGRNPSLLNEQSPN